MIHSYNLFIRNANVVCPLARVIAADGDQFVLCVSTWFKPASKRRFSAEIMTTLDSDHINRRKIRCLGQAHQPGVASAIKLVNLVVKLFIAIDHLAVAGLLIAYLRRLNLKANHLVGKLHKSTITSLNTIAEGLKRVSRVTFR